MTSFEQQQFAEQLRLQILNLLVDFYKATGAGIWSVDQLMVDAENILKWTIKTT